MINKKLMILAIFLVSLLAVSAVSAADNSTDDIASADKTTDEVVSIEENQTILKENNDVGTFDDLQKEIDNAPVGSVLNLTRDYNGAEDKVVRLNKDLTIDGQGHTIDCLGDDCSAFYSSSGTITLMNLKIINGHNDDNYKGGAIHIEGSDLYTIINCTFNNNWADDYGGAIYNGGNPLTIINCIFNNNEADDEDGGAIFSEGYLTIIDSIFTENKAYGAGGVIYATGTVDIKNTIFKNNKADGAYFGCNGGVIRSDGDVKVDNCSFLNNFANDYGGAIYASTVKSINSNFQFNTADDIDGGAIYANYVNVMDSIFTENKVQGSGSRGGAIYSNDAVIVKNSTFTNNWADNYGGAINAIGNVKIINCNFQFNTADDEDGGAINTNGSVNIIDSIFIGNKANVDGGAIMTIGSVDIKNTTFENNSLSGPSRIDTSEGGAIKSFGDVKVDNCSFLNNHADDNGGAIIAKSVESINSNFQSNTADDCSGAIHATGVATIRNTTFANNEANYGGAIYAIGSVNVIDSIFTENKAHPFGGAIYATENVDIESTTFENNKVLISSVPAFGGAIHAEGSVNVRKSHFTENNAEVNGGAIYAEGSVNVMDSILTENRVQTDGGAIYGEENVDIKNTIFKNNEASGSTAQCTGGAIRSDGDVKVDNCSFLNNRAYDYGGAIYANTITWVESPSYFIGNYVDDNKGGAIWTNKFETDVKYGVFINNTAKAKDDGGAVYIDDENYITFSQCYFENNRCGDEGGAIYLNSEKSHVTLKSNVFADNWAGDKGNIVYNCGYYDYIGYNWFGANSFDFSNELVEYKRWTSDISHTDEHMINAVMYIDDNLTVGKEAKLTIYFSNENTPADLFMINPSFSADNGAVLSDWHTFNGSTYVTGITLAKTSVTHITAKVPTQILELDVTSFRANLTLNASAEPINPGENATVIVTGLKNATGDVFVVVNFTEWSGKIDNGVAKIIVSGLKESTTAVVTFYSDDNYNPAQTTVNITVNPKPKENLTIEAIAKPMTVGANATVIVTGLKNATGNVTVTVNNKTYTAPIKDGKSTVLIPGITENVTAIVKYAGDERYNPALTTVNITVNPAVDTRLQSKIYLRNALYFVTQTKMVKVTLWDANNKPIANKTVHITLNAHNLTYSGVSDENGDAYIRVGVGFGVHNATVSFDGDDMYVASNRTGQIRVIKETPSVMVRGDNQKFSAKDNSKTVKVYLWDRNSKPLPVNSKVAIKLNGVTYIGYTDSNGIASIKINVNTPGTFNAQVMYAGNSAYNAVSRSVKFTIS